MEKGETSLDNVVILEFWNSIMFKCVGWSGAMTYTMIAYKRTKTNVFTTIICVHDFYLLFMEIFNKWFKFGKYDLYIRFAFHWIEPNITSEMINKHAIVEETTIYKVGEVHTSEKIIFNG